MPAGIGFTGDGGLDVAGLEWLGAGAYDPAARGFLSTDPLASALGAGWDGNPTVECWLLRVTGLRTTGDTLSAGWRLSAGRR